MRAIEVNRVEPAYDERAFAFEEAPEALRYLASGAHFAKVCVRVAREAGGNRAEGGKRR